MKKLIALLIALLITITSFAQGRGINYKAVVKDNLGNVVANQTINVRFNILSSTSSSVYAELHNTTTDANGIVVVTIGEGDTIISGEFFGFNWGNDLYQLQTEIDTEQDGDFEFLSITQFNAVPYAYSSMDNLWQLNGDNAVSIAEKVGIGTGTPTELLHISDPNNAGLKLETPEFSDTSSIKLENGDISGEHTFFKIENTNDRLSIAVDSDLNAETGYVEKLSISPTGSINTTGTIKVNNGATISEFSTDGTLSGNSNSAVPTEAAVKTYVDNIAGGSKTIIIPASAFHGSNSNVSYVNSVVARYNSGTIPLLAPVILPVGSIITNINVYLRDDNTINNLDVRLMGSTSTVGGTLINIGSTSGASYTGQILSFFGTFTILDNFQYLIKVVPVGEWVNDDFGILRVRITYTE